MGFEEIQERWHIIDKFENYAVTESGRVYSINPNRNGYNGLRELAQRSINNPKRYLSVCCCKNNKEYYFQIHQLVGKYFVEGYFEYCKACPSCNPDFFEKRQETNLYKYGYIYPTQNKDIKKKIISKLIKKSSE